MEISRYIFKLCINDILNPCDFSLSLLFRVCRIITTPQLQVSYISSLPRRENSGFLKEKIVFVSRRSSHIPFTSTALPPMLATRQAKKVNTHFADSLGKDRKAGYTDMVIFNKLANDCPNFSSYRKSYTRRWQI